MTDRQAEDLQVAVWFADAEDGVFNLPRDISGKIGYAIAAAMQRYLRRGEPNGTAGVWIDTDNGDVTAWQIAAVVQKLEACVFIGQRCVSAGIIIAVAGATRRCVTEYTRFGWHGSPYKPGHDASGMSDYDRATYMAERTAGVRARRGR